MKIEYDENRQTEYLRELEGAMNGLKDLLANAQHRIGVIESFMYLMRKESARKDDPMNGKEG